MITERAGTGIAVDPGHSAALVLAAKGLLADPERRTKMGTAGRRFADTTFSSDRVGGRFTIGIVLHTGSQRVVLGDRLAAVPVSDLWA